MVEVLQYATGTSNASSGEVLSPLGRFRDVSKFLILLEVKRFPRVINSREFLAFRNGIFDNNVISSEYLRLGKLPREWSYITYSKG